MPPVTTTSEESQASIKGRVMDTAKQMKRDNEISKGVLFKTPFSEELARRIGSPNSAKYITRNRITGGLWLVENIELSKRLIPPKDGT
jgi:hypothetical protein